MCDIMNNNKDVNEVKDERSLGGKLYDKRKHILFLSLSIISILAISTLMYRRGYKEGISDGYGEGIEKIMNKYELDWESYENSKN